jgi:glutaminase
LLVTNSASRPDPISAGLEELRDRLAGVDSGEIATYIPELAHADPAWFGIALCTLGGLYQAGDSQHPFTIQSVSKPFVYALALADQGMDRVLSHVGVEPSGEAFNAIRLDPDGRPFNPMINAGAIVTSWLVAGDSPDEKFERIRSGLSAFAGRELQVDEQVLASEMATADGNRALCYLMRSAGTLTCDVEEALSVYFRQCSLLVTAADLAVMAGTLAAGGVDPVSRRVVIGPTIAQHVLTVMATCGTYDFSGEWLLRAGMPAKSGVSGGLAAALPGQFGLGVFSAPLDRHGNSVRATAVCRELADRFGLHLMRRSVRELPVFHHLTTARGGSVLICELQSDMGFTGAETVIRDVSARLDGVRWLVLDLSQVGELETVAVTLLSVFTQQLAGQGIQTGVTDARQRGLFRGNGPEYATLDDALRQAAVFPSLLIINIDLMGGRCQPGDMKPCAGNGWPPDAAYRAGVRIGHLPRGAPCLVPSHARRGRSRWPAPRLSPAHSPPRAHRQHHPARLRQT